MIFQILLLHIEDNEGTYHNIELVKRPRGRPKKEKTPQEPRKRGRPSNNKPRKEKQPRGRRRIYEIGAILKPLDLDYFKTYYETVPTSESSSTP